MADAVQPEKIEIAGRRPDGMPKGRGGARPGSGRKPKPKNASLLERAYAVLDEATLPAVQAVVDLLTSTEPRYRLEAAKLILSKCIPDLQHQVGDQTKIVNVVRVANLLPAEANGSHGS